MVGNLTKNGFGPPMTVGNCQFNGSFVAFTVAPGGRWTVGSVVIPAPAVAGRRTEPVAQADPDRDTEIDALADADPDPDPDPDPDSDPDRGSDRDPDRGSDRDAHADHRPGWLGHRQRVAARFPGGRPMPSLAASVAPIGPSPTPVMAGEATPAPTPGSTEPPAVGGPNATPEPSLPAWEESVLGIEDVSSDAGAIGEASSWRSSCCCSSGSSGSCSATPSRATTA